MLLTVFELNEHHKIDNNKALVFINYQVEVLIAICYYKNLFF